MIKCARRLTDDRGQVFVLTALMMVVLVGITALAIDVSSALLTQRWERSVADASALAGAQDLQKPGSRSMTGPELSAAQARAKTDAMKILVDQLRGTSAPSSAVCFTSMGCAMPGTAYAVSIQTPSPTCVDCDPERAVQVSVRQPSFGLTFGRIFGESTWAISSTSVAGMVQARQYGLVALRPPKPRANGSDANEDDIKITGGSIVTIEKADAGTNTNMIYSGTNSILKLTDGKMYHYDAYPAWSGAPSPVQTSTLLQDPMYTIPQRTASTPIYTTFDQAKGTNHDTRCPAVKLTVPAEYKIRTGVSIRNLPDSQVTCLLPGVYNFTSPGAGQSLSNTDSNQAFLLEPGVYYLDRGLQNSSTIIGGWVGGQPGVALVFLEANNRTGSSPGQLDGQSSDVLALNMGSQYLRPGGQRATAAEGPQGLVQTSGPKPVLMTLMVEPDRANCYVALQEPSTCNNSKNKTLNLPGGGNLFVAGVQYAPTDNVFVKGNSVSTGTLGQIISWTIEFNSSFLNLEAANAETNGVLRLDPACSPTQACTP